MSTSPTTPTVNVPVTSAWSSKVNWTQAVAAAAMILTLVSGGKIGITPEQQAAAVVVIGVIGLLLDLAMRSLEQIKTFRWRSSED